MSMEIVKLSLPKLTDVVLNVSNLAVEKNIPLKDVGVVFVNDEESIHVFLEDFRI